MSSFDYRPRENDQGGPVQKRSRITKSCTLCRQRKIKCDKVKPACGSCSKKGSADLCKYEDAEWTINVLENNGKSNITIHHPNKVNVEPLKLKDESVDEQLVLMKDKLRQIESAILSRDPQRYHDYSPKDYSPNIVPGSTPQLQLSMIENGLEADGIIDFYRNNHGNPKMISQGVLSWVTLTKKDIYLRSIVDSSRKKKIIANTSKAQVSEGRESEFASKFRVEQDLDVEIKSTSTALSWNYKNKDIVYLIENTLKDAKLIWSLVDKFFESELYCALPLIDKSDFTSHLFDIIGPKNSQEILLHIKKKIQLTTVGILMIIMRLSSLATFNASKCNFETMSDNDKYIYRHPVNIDILTVARRCYDEISVFRESHMEIFQFQLFLKYYDFIAPEDSDCISMSSNANMGPLIHSAISAGLNRDPTISESRNKNPNLLRRLWFKVVNLDYNQLMLTGCPPFINLRYYDTHYPHLDPNDSALEYGINKGISEGNDIYDMCHLLLMLILNIREPPLMSSVKLHLKPLERFVKEHRKVEDIMKMPSDGILERWEKIRLVSSLVDSTSLLYMIYYHFYLYYNDRGVKDKSVFYIAEMLKLMSYLLPLIKFLLKDSDASNDFNLINHFGVPLIVIPKIDLSAQRCIQLMFSILARIKATKIFSSDIDQQKLDLLDSIAESALRTCSYIMKGFLNIADTYYHAWILNKMHTFIVKDILHNKKGPYNPENVPDTDKEFITNLNAVREHDEIFDKYTLNDLELIRQSLENLEFSFRDSERTSPAGSSVDFSTTDNNIDSKWFSQLQSGTDILYDDRSNSEYSTFNETFLDGGGWLW